MNGPKVLLLDIETAPILAYIWKLFDENIGLNQIHTDWFILAFCAKWAGERQLIYRDQRGKRNKEDDLGLLRHVWRLLDEADIVVTQNGKKFDEKKLNARFVLNGMKPPSSYKSIDTCQIARKRFGFTSNKLAYLAAKLTGQKKLEHRKFAGFELWRACLQGDASAWREMEKYNKQDVRALEALYEKLVPWDSPGINQSLYYAGLSRVCSCGGTEFKRNGYAYTARGKYQRHACVGCGREFRAGENLLSELKRASL